MIGRQANDRGRTETRTGAHSNDGAASTAGSGPGALLRSAVTGIGIGAVAYLAFRRARGTDAPLERVRETTEGAVPERVRETVDEAVPKRAREIPIGGSSRDSADNEELGGDAVAGVDRSNEELSALGEENVGEEPAEPGEMTVDEDIVDGLVDEGDEGDDGNEE